MPPGFIVISRCDSISPRLNSGISDTSRLIWLRSTMPDRFIEPPSSVNVSCRLIDDGSANASLNPFNELPSMPNAFCSADSSTVNREFISNPLSLSSPKVSPVNTFVPESANCVFTISLSAAFSAT